MLLAQAPGVGSMATQHFPVPPCNAKAWQDGGFPLFRKGQRNHTCELTHNHCHRYTHTGSRFIKRENVHAVLNVGQAQY